MAKKPPRGNAKGDPTAIPGIKRASEIQLTPQQQAAQIAKRGPLSTPAGMEPTPGRTVQLSATEYTLSSTAAAKLIGISNSTLIRKTEEHNFPHRRLGTSKLPRYRFRPEDLPTIAAKLFNDPSGPAPLPPTIADVDQQTNPIIERLRKDKPSMFRGFQAEDWEELFSIHGDGGALTEAGVEATAEHIKWKRGVLTKASVILESDHGETLAGIVDSMFKQATMKR